MFKTTVCLVGLSLLIGHIKGSEEETSSEETNNVDDHPAWSRLPSECGRTRFDSDSNRIIRGEVAKLGQFPWMAHLGNDILFFCSGAILSKFYVLSAAHCAINLTFVRVCDNNVVTVIDCDDDLCAPRYQDLTIRKLLFTNYDKDSPKRDILLIELQNAIKFNDFVQPICLPRGEHLQKNLIGRTVHIAGWGITNSTTMKQVANLMYVSIPIVDIMECYSVFGDVVDLDRSMFCAGEGSKGEQSYLGDSGGPVTVSEVVGGQRRNVVLGIVSFGSICCGTVSVYTRVAFYVRWILSQITVG